MALTLSQLSPACDAAFGSVEVEMTDATLLDCSIRDLVYFYIANDDLRNVIESSTILRERLLNFGLQDGLGSTIRCPQSGFEITLNTALGTPPVQTGGLPPAVESSALDLHLGGATYRLTSSAWQFGHAYPMQSLLTAFREEALDGDTLFNTRNFGDETPRLEKKVMRHRIQSAEIASRNLHTIEDGLEKATDHAARLAALISTVDEGCYSWLWPAEGSTFDACTMELLSSRPQDTKADTVFSVAPGLTFHVDVVQTVVVRALVAHCIDEDQ